jgi:hypothetical protein
MSLTASLAGFAFRLALFAWYAHSERRWARWLPWWRRYLSLLPMSLWVVGAERLGKVGFFLTVACCAIHLWNCLTANRNKRDGNDVEAQEAAEAQLTDVNNQSFGRQVAEVVGG